MKWFRITSPGWQIIIVLALVIFLGWHSMPVPGPDGQVICEVYELPFAYDASYRAISIHQTGQPESTEEAVIVSHAAIVRTVFNKPIFPLELEWVANHAPRLIDMLPFRWRCRLMGGDVLDVSMTEEEWKLLRDARRNDGWLTFEVHQEAEGQK